MDHPLIGKRIEHPDFEGGIVAYVTTDADDDFVALVITDTGEMQHAHLWVQRWRIVTPEPTATAAPEPDADGWIPLDGHTFPDVSPDTHIVVRHRDGTEYKYRADSVNYRHTGSDHDVLAWRRA